MEPYVRHESWAARNMRGEDREWTPTRAPRTVSASANVNPLDDVLLVSGNSTATLETAVGCDGRKHTFHKTDSSATTMTIACTGAQTLDGAATLTRTSQYASVTVKSNGTNWVIVASFDPSPTFTDLTLTGNLTVKGNTTLGDAAGDALTIAPNAVTWSNNPTHSGNHTFSGNLIVNGNTTIGDASGDTLTINAGTWTIGSNWNATRAIGAAAAGTTNSQKWDVTFTGDSGGTTNLRSFYYTSTSSGGNAINVNTGIRTEQAHAGSATLTTGQGVNSICMVTSTGNVSNLLAYAGSVQLTNSGAVTSGQVYVAQSPTLSSTGAITTLSGFVAQNLGHATLVTNAHGFLCQDFTASATLTVSYRGQMTSGTGKWNCYMDGNANNAFAGNVRIGSTVAPTVALDVTGAGLFSTTLGVTGHVTFEGVTSTGATGTGKLVFDGTPTLVTPVIGAATGTSLAVTGGLSTSSATAGVGYATGAGGTVTQGAGSGKATAVTLDKSTGQITLNNAALAAATIVTFVLNSTAVAAADLIVATHHSAGTTGAYTINARATGSGTAAIDVRNNTAGSLSEAIVIKYAVIKAATS